MCSFLFFLINEFIARQRSQGHLEYIQENREGRDLYPTAGTVLEYRTDTYVTVDTRGRQQTKD